MGYVFPNRVEAESPRVQAEVPRDMTVFFEPQDDLTAKELYVAIGIGFGTYGWTDLPCDGVNVTDIRADIAEAGAERHFRWEPIGSVSV